MARKFFYVCAGLLCVVAAFGVGFGVAKAQSGVTSYYAGVGGASAAVSGRTVYYLSNVVPTPTAYPAPVPGGAEIASVLVYNAGYTVPASTVVLADGTVYHWSGVVQSWQMMGSYGAPTAATHTSLGSLKARYR